VAIWNASHHHAAIDPQVILAALGAAAFFYARTKVTPTADPKDGNGQPLIAVPPSGVGGVLFAPMPAPPEKTLIPPAAAAVTEPPAAAGPEGA
jgi:hypothetical protein